jgi:membrane protease YdiL (CAAX protease family)
LVLIITAIFYATGLRGDDSGTASNSVIEKAFAAGPDGAVALLITTVFLAPILEETVFRGFLLPSLTRRGCTKPS